MAPAHVANDRSYSSMTPQFSGLTSMTTKIGETNTREKFLPVTRENTRLRRSVVPDPDFWIPIRQNYEIFLDPEPDWISIFLKPDPDPDYPKRFEHFLIFLRFVFFLRKFY